MAIVVVIYCQQSDSISNDMVNAISCLLVCNSSHINFVYKITMTHVDDGLDGSGEGFSGLGPQLLGCVGLGFKNWPMPTSGSVCLSVCLSVTLPLRITQKLRTDFDGFSCRRAFETKNTWLIFSSNPGVINQGMHTLIRLTASRCWSCVSFDEILRMDWTVKWE